MDQLLDEIVDDGLVDRLRGTLKPRLSRPNPSEARQVAIHHAKLLQHRKELERQILESIIQLSEFPLERGPAYSAACPAPSDARAFKEHVRVFQSSDYEALVEERHVNGLCGYALCPEPHRVRGPGGEWLIYRGNIVPRNDVENWCSDLCARRAMYVQVQLNETAAWERAGRVDIHMDLLDERHQAKADQDGDAAAAAQAVGREDAARIATALARERGDDASLPGLDKVKVDIRDKEPGAPHQAGTTTVPADAASPADAENAHLLIDGHMSRLPFRPKPIIDGRTSQLPFRPKPKP